MQQNREQLEICQMFTSLQGEGVEQGAPTSFIRLSGCNLRCDYCDTKYSWKQGKKKSIAGIVNWLKKEGVNRVEITGGEPLLQKNCLKLLEVLIKNNYSVSLNTNGTQPLTKIPAKVIKIVDLKSFLPQSSDFKVAKLNKNDQLKCVIGSRKDYNFYKNYIIKNKKNMKCRIYFTAAKKVTSRQLANWILKDRLSVQLHLQQHKLIGLK